MNIATITPRSLIKRGIKEEQGGSSTSNAAGSNLSFYGQPPSEELSLDEFEEIALARLKVLRMIEELKTRNIIGDAFSLVLDKTIKENLHEPAESAARAAASSSNSKKMNVKTAIQKAKERTDVASHYILRAAYCKTEELRRWFLTQETFLFRYQLEKVANDTTILKLFLKRNDLHFDPVPDDEKRNVTPQLLSIPNGFNSSDSKMSNKMPSATEVASTTYYKIPFQEAADLIAKRQCFVKAGYAYVPMRRIVTIITAKFRIALSKSLAGASRAFGTVAADYAPVAPLLNSMNSQYTGKEYGADGANGIGGGDGDYELTHLNIEQYKESMPLCMSELHKGLQNDNKLRHHGRLQYGLFLKGAGMSMEESIIFFQKIFTKIMTAEKFQKEYTYNIRHMYGKEGKRTNYTPYSCTKIILGSPPGTGDHHGCPYRNYDDTHLAAVLSQMKIGNAMQRSEMIKLKKEKHYNIACQKHFEYMHPNASSVQEINLSGVGDHPNAWYTSSVAYRAAMSAGSNDEKMTETPQKEATASNVVSPMK
mmetsp:Transcript_20524/g.31139  ORF Transcript_20524/g.31139 Transcript_20524/m.31139 type:complete len:537 (-) Transcript_20524:134-1744(-)|eukprot:CAMPEP_0194089044 /NCGR_PEP_ID=MMETSP0149-20130528/32377_1 /TAXON_ID=122233 /ORGANISM="Chaetoceros debilis, Strain MM31A-1" /LENGTH=536 /DNA_ID=CAMNT_0038772843 /DNA_START=38 /DNA_END=1648 /DNA_ORIENTATION=-